MKKLKTMGILTRLEKYAPFLICFAFFIAYSVLSVVKHNHFLSGYDLGVSDQAVWLMSKFKNPISSTHAYANTSLFSDHVEIIYALISPIYWFFNDVRILIVLQAFLISFSAIPIYYLAKMKKLKKTVIYAILLSFLMFYGIQNAIWADVHSLVIAASIFPWFIYFLYKNKNKLAIFSFFLLLSCKEDIALLTFILCFIYYIIERRKIALLLMGLSVIYLFLIFFVYYPNFTPDGYRFQNENGLLSNLNLSNMYNTQAKRDVLLYSFAWFGFLPVLSPLHMLLALGDLGHYFVLGSNYVTSAQSIFLHYRVTLAAFLVWPLILVIAKYKRLNNNYIALYILVCAAVLQYTLHLPLSYLTKRWFWTETAGVKNIREVLPALPAHASVVSQVNITPHINHREQVFTLWPEKKAFQENSPCGEPTCDWFRWVGKPMYLLVDISPEWDARHLLINNEEFARGIRNLEKEKVISPVKKHKTAALYKILKNP
ncbi:MAG TPA: DUF2079 domain-containing protein [Xanthomonadales bacterium]|nr:DUF2079 domain-containing protein [Xanthomonadales bacterium]